MKRTILFLALLLSSLGAFAQSYDFSAVAPSGQRLYYKIVNGNAEVSTQNSSYPYYSTYPIYDGPSGSLEIPATVTNTSNGITYAVSSIGNNAFFDCLGLTSVTIPNSVASIGDGAFYYCSGLTSINIPSSVTSIGNSAFYGCGFLTDVTIGNSVTCIGGSAFENCSALTSVTIGNSVTSIGANAFYNCSSLTNVTIPNSVISIGNSAFFNVKLVNYCGSATGTPWEAKIVGCFYEEGDFIFEDDTKTTLVGYIGTGTSVTIPSSVTSIGMRAFYGCSSLANVTIPNSVSNIEYGAFESCSGLTSITIPNSVTSIGDNAFRNCTGLTNVTIPNSVTSIGNYAFLWCDGLSSITIPNSVTSIGSSAFSYCSGLTSVTIPNSVTSIGDNAFYYCFRLTSVTIPNSVTSIGRSAFYRVKVLNYCGSATGRPWGANRVGCFYEEGDFIFEDDTKTTILAYIGTGTNVTIPNSVTSIGDNTFYMCSNLTNVTIPNSVTSIGDTAFLGCTSLNSVIIPNSVISIGNYAFRNCTGLTNVTIPNSVISIGDYAFYYCFGLTSVTIKAETVPTMGSYVYTLVPTNIPVYVPCGKVSDYQAANGWSQFTNIQEDPSCLPHYDLYYTFNGTSATVYGSAAPGRVAIANNGTFEELDIPSSVTYNGTSYSVTSIGENAFQFFSDPTSVFIPNSVTSIGNYSFFACSGITSVTISNSVTSIGDYAFGGCSGLVNVTIPNSVTSIGEWAFTYCSDLMNITIPNSVTSIGDNAFVGVRLVNYCGSAVGSPWGANYAGCNPFEEDDFIYEDDTKTTLVGYIGTDMEVTIPNTVTSIRSSAFEGCSSLTSVTIGNSVTSIGSSTFYNCSGLISVTIPNSVTFIGDYAFFNCSGLTSLTIPNSVTSIGNSVFFGCSGLTSVTIPNSVTSIGNYAFRSCSGLTSITIPNSVTSIGDLVFDDCSSLASISVDAGNANYDSRNDCNAIIETINNTLVQGCKNTIIPNSVTSIGWAAFSHCYGLTSIIIPNSVTCIGDDAFSFCSGLTSATIPNSVTSIENNAFEGCRSLTSVSIPNSVIVIGSSVFLGCSSLTSVTIGSSVTSIGGSAFSGCTQLATVYDYSNLPITRGSSNNGGVAQYATRVVKVLTDDRGDFNAPNDYTVDEVTYTRNYEQGNRSTICLPFKPATVNGSSTTNLKFYEFADFDGTTITFNEVDFEDLAANTPYMVEWPALKTAQDFVFGATDATIPATGDAASRTVEHGNGKFIGTMTRTCMNSSNYGYKNGYFVQSADGTQEEPADHAHVNPFRAYFQITPSGSQGFAMPTEIAVRFNTAEDNVGIDSVEPQQSNIRYSNDVYDMMGRMVRKNAENLDGLRKGVYIWKGEKKVVF